MKRTLLALLVPALAFQALADSPADSLKRLETALKNVPAGNQPGLPMVPVLLPQLQSLIASQDYAQALNLMQQLASVPLSDDVRKAVTDLTSALNAEVAAREKAANERAEKLIEKAKATLKTAKTPADLDALLQEISALKLQPGGRYYSESNQNARTRLEGVYRFLTRWQDYLVAITSGNTENARNILRNLADSEPLLIPRSELLALGQPGKPGAPQRPVEDTAAELIVGTRQLEDVRALIPKLHALRNEQRSSNTLQTMIVSLEQIDRYYREYLEGMPPGIEVVNNGITSGYVSSLKMQLLALIVPKAVGASGFNAKPGETPLDLLHRIAEESKTSGDLQTAFRANEAIRQLQRTGQWNSNDQNAVSSFVIARNQETAGQWAEAVAAYRNTLKIGSDLVPAKLIGLRLEEIRKNHPEEYAKGVEQFNAIEARASTFNGYPVRFAAPTPPQPAPPQPTPAK